MAETIPPKIMQEIKAIAAEGYSGPSIVHWQNGSILMIEHPKKVTA